MITGIIVILVALLIAIATVNVTKYDHFDESMCKYCSLREECKLTGKKRCQD